MRLKKNFYPIILSDIPAANAYAPMPPLICQASYQSLEDLDDHLIYWKNPPRSACFPCPCTKWVQRRCLADILCIHYLGRKHGKSIFPREDRFSILPSQQGLRSQADRSHPSRRRTPMLLCRRREAKLTDRRRSPMLLCRRQSVRQVSPRGKPRRKLASGLRPLGTPI